MGVMVTMFEGCIVSDPMRGYKSLTRSAMSSNTHRGKRENNKDSY